MIVGISVKIEREHYVSPMEWSIANAIDYRGLLAWYRPAL